MGVPVSGRYCTYFQVNAGPFLERDDYTEQIYGGRIALGPEHPHQALRGIPVALASAGKPIVALM
jgi:hypothetical protein